MKDLIANSVVIGGTNVITEIGNKQDEIDNTIDITMKDLVANSAVVNSVDIGSGFTSLQTQVDAVIEYITNVGFRVFRLTNTTFNAGSKLGYDQVEFDTESGYSTTNFTYTISLAGTYLFTFQNFTPNGVEMSVDLIRVRGETETILQQITNGTSTSQNNSAYNLTAITQSLTGDIIFGRVSSGSVRVSPVDVSSPLASFSGSRLSN